MSGQFNPSALPKRPGAYFNFQAAPQVAIPPTVGSVVAVPFTHSWGPDNVPVTLGSMADFSALYLNDLTNTGLGYRAVRQAFVGENTRGRRGAGAVIAYRMAAASAAKATVNLMNTTPAAALRVDAIYKGTRGNALRVTTQTDPVDATKRDLIILDGTVEVERFVYDPTVATPLAVLAAAVNGVSRWVTLTVLIDTVALAAVTSVPLTGGLDGATLTTTEWSNMQTGMETQRFDYLAPFDLIDAPTIAAMKTWAQNANAKGRRFFVVLGGALGESITTAVTRSGTLNDPDFVNIGVGQITDLDMTDQNGNPLVLSTSQFVPRLAGIMSALGEDRSLAGARIGNVTIQNNANEAGIDTAYDGGVVVLTMDTDPDAPVHVEKGLTTFTTKTDPARPYNIFKTPKFVRTMHDLQIEIDGWVRSNVLGQLQVNSKTRSAVVAELSRRLQLRQDAQVIQSGWTVAVSAIPPPLDSVEYIALDYSLAFGRSVEQVLNTIKVA